MPCRRRSKFEKPIWRTTVLMAPSILDMMSARRDLVSPASARRFFRKVNVVISPKTEAVSQ